MKRNSSVKTLSRMFFIGVLLLSMLLTVGEPGANATEASPQLEWSLEAELPIPDAAGTGDFILHNRDSVEFLTSKLSGEGVSTELMPVPNSGLKGLSATRYLLKASAKGSVEDFRRILYSTMKPEFDLLGGTTEITISAGSLQSRDLQIVIESKPSTGYLWNIVSDSAQITIKPNRFEMHTRGLGVAQRQVLQLHAAKTGSTSLQVIYRRPWESTAATRRLTLKLDSLTDKLDLSDPTAPTGPLPAIRRTAADSTAFPAIAKTELPASWDWRTQGIVTPVRDQGSCGGCWSFGTVGVMESALLKSGAGSTDLSEQFLISCNTSGWDCDGGGLTAHMYHYDRLGKNQNAIGAVLEADKPFTESNGSCNEAYNHPYKLSGWKFITPTEFDMPTVDQIKSAIYTYGPVTGGICAGDAFDAYTGGVFSTNETSGCDGSTNHQIILVGWNDNGGNGYWILKNSWGPGWGIKGYMNIAYNTSRVGEGTSWVTTNPVGNLPNLAPVQPSGWSDKIVVSKTTGTTIDTSPIYTTDSLYVDWAVINSGTASITTSFKTSLYVDGNLVNSWDTASLAAGAYKSIADYSIGTLSAGAHSIKIVADSTGVIGESNETDNEYTKTITVTDGGCNPTPITAGQTVSGSLTTDDCPSSVRGDSYYADQYSFNASAGQQVAILLKSSTFNTYLYLMDASGSVIASNNDGGGGTNSRIPSGSGYFKLPSAGTYIIEVTSYDADRTGNYALTFTNQTAPPKPNLTPYRPNGWSDKIVVSKTKGTSTDGVNLRATDILYLDWAVINNGKVPIKTRFIMSLYVDGKQKASWFANSLGINTYAYVRDYTLGRLKAGTHAIKIVMDTTGAIDESNEGDNEYTKTITVNR